MSWCNMGQVPESKFPSLNKVAPLHERLKQTVPELSAWPGLGP